VISLGKSETGDEIMPLSFIVSVLFVIVILGTNDFAINLKYLFSLIIFWKKLKG
jgi:hypothetical protein